MRTTMEALFLLSACLASTILLVRGQYQSGFISIDCGISEGSDYSDETTDIPYTSDVKYIDTGKNANISPDIMSNINILPHQLSTVRSFPHGNNSCYTLKPEQAKGNKYLIRAIFMYGNYDSRDQPPEFELYLEVDVWETVKLADSSTVVVKEIIHVPTTDYIHICLVNTGYGTPFISALELRQLNSSTYVTESGSLALDRRLDIGSTTNQTVRYKKDVYDRIWEPFTTSDWEPLSASYTSDLLSNNDYKPPTSVMSTAVRPVNGKKSMDFIYTPADSNEKFYFYIHFAEVEELRSNQLRKFNISLNGYFWYGNVVPGHLRPFIVYSIKAVSGDALRFSFYMTNNSTLPPILNALEIYVVKDFPQSPTSQNEVDAIRYIKAEYGVERNWQGDPCAPRSYSWDGLKCSYNGYNAPTIISLNLSSSALSGTIALSISDLQSLQYLDLSNNRLTGTVPDFLSQMPALKTLNLSGNKLTGSVPTALIERTNSGSLLLSVDGNPNLCQNVSCKKKKKKMNILVPVFASIVLCMVLLTALAFLWSLKRRKRQATEFLVKPKEEWGILEAKNQQYAYSEIEIITSNFQKELGKGGFGRVFGGHLKDGTEVAVKMISPSSTQGFKQFLTEAQLLTKVHHRNLVSLFGYCKDGQHLGLIYEFMAKGNLQELLSEKNAAPLSWEQRLQIAVDAAQGLEYLHNGCKPPIIHRDIKTSNILLNENLQAKMSDFGLSRSMPLDGGTHVSTTVAGTFGYYDPEYYVSHRLNEKSDVYSFGIVLLELITGQLAIIEDHDEKTNIVQWVDPMLERGEIRNIVDSRLQGDFNINSAWKAVDIAMACVTRNSIKRPTMSHVLMELKECLASKTNEYYEIRDSIVINSENSWGPDAR